MRSRPLRAPSVPVPADGVQPAAVVRGTSGRRYLVPVLATVVLLALLASMAWGAAHFRGGSGYGYGYNGYGAPNHTRDCFAGNAAPLTSGDARLGVCHLGDLGILGGASAAAGPGSTTLGLRFVPTNAEGIGGGCACEGWGAGDATSHVSGTAMQVQGARNLTPVSFTAEGGTATSVVEVGATLRVTQAYAPKSDGLFEDTVTITNLSSVTVAPRYRRVVAWQAQPNPLKGFVSLGGYAQELTFSSDDGYAQADPLTEPSKIFVTAPADRDGPADHGAQFNLAFEPLGAGESHTFSLYFGAAANAATALSALKAAGAQAWALGESAPAVDAGTTFSLGFKGATPAPGDAPVEVTPAPPAAPPVAKPNPGPAPSPSPAPVAATAAAIAKALAADLRPSGRSGRLAAILRAKGYPLTVHALGPGRLTIRWYMAGKKSSHGKGKHAAKVKPMLIGAGATTFAAAGTAPLKVGLSKSGMKAIKRAKHVKVTAVASFAPAGAPAVPATLAFTLRR